MAFIPVNQEDAEALRAKMSKTFMRDPETFIEAYNSGFVSRSNPTAKAYAKAITSTFKDVRERRGRLILVSENEIRLSEAYDNLSAWVTIARLKRELNDLIREGSISTSDQLVVLEDGSVARLSQHDAGDDEYGSGVDSDEDASLSEDVVYTDAYGSYTAVESIDKLKVSEIADFASLRGVSKVEEVLYFSPETVLALDDSFITNLHIPSVVG